MRFLSVLVVSLVLGALTSLGQQYLPPELTSVANSAGSWTLVAFGLSLLARRWWVAVVFASVSLLALLGGYAIASELRGFAVSTSLWVFWGAAAAVVGPAVALLGTWARRDPGLGRSACVAALSGLLVGEGVYGLTVVGDTTSPVYWTISIVVGVIGLVLFGWLRRPVRQAVVATVLTAVVAVAFLLVYQQSLIQLL